MRIAFYAPFKPLDHPNPSGDQMIGRGICSFLKRQGHQVVTVSRLRSRWIYWKPFALLQALSQRQRIRYRLRKEPVDLWLTYHSYYKAPDLLGPAVCPKVHLPYVIMQPSFATRVSRNWKTRPGFLLNRRALHAADALVTDREQDFINLQRIIAADRLYRIRPGLDPAAFSRNREAGTLLRQDWQVGNKPVILTAARFRSDVKTESLRYLLESCIRLHKDGHDFLLVIAGDGPQAGQLQQLAASLPTEKVRFVGRIAREEMNRFYSAADLFAFPGINESLGMVFLEAQSCGLPVIACNNGGIAEVVGNGLTGLLTELDRPETFDRALISLLADQEKRDTMGKAAARRIRTQHDINKNYLELEQILLNTVKRHGNG